jgi:hypothetical protein
MPKKKDPPLSTKEQFKRFIEAVRTYEVDESGKEFGRAFKKAVPPKRGRKRPSK